MTVRSSQPRVAAVPSGYGVGTSPLGAAWAHGGYPAGAAPGPYGGAAAGLGPGGVPGAGFVGAAPAFMASYGGGPHAAAHTEHGEHGGYGPETRGPGGYASEHAGRGPAPRGDPRGSAPTALRVSGYGGSGAAAPSAGDGGSQPLVGHGVDGGVGYGGVAPSRGDGGRPEFDGVQGEPAAAATYDGSGAGDGTGAGYAAGPGGVDSGDGGDGVAVGGGDGGGDYE